MVLNFKVLEKIQGKYGFKEADIFGLIAIKSRETGKIEEYFSSERLVDLIDKGVLKQVKPKNKQQPLSDLVRLEKTIEKELKSLSTDYSSWTEDEEVIFEWLEKHYLSKGKEVGNPNRVKKLLHWFGLETGIRKNDLILLIVDFLNDEYVDETSKVLEYCLFYPKKFTTDKGRTIAYEAKPDIYDSWLFKYFEKNKERLLEVFESNN